MILNCKIYYKKVKIVSLKVHLGKKKACLNLVAMETFKDILGKKFIAACTIPTHFTTVSYNHCSLFISLIIPLHTSTYVHIFFNKYFFVS